MHIIIICNWSIVIKHIKKVTALFKVHFLPRNTVIRRAILLVDDGTG